MSRSLSYNFLRRLTAYIRSNTSLANLTLVSAKTNCFKAGKLLLLSQICSTVNKNETPVEIDLDDGLRKACEEGDMAIIRLMNQLKEVIIIVSNEYRICLTKQIEITKAASNLGPLSEVWDELPQYRLLALELNKELSDYKALFNTIGQMTYDESLVHFVTGSNDNLDSVGVTYKELEIVLNKEFEENRKMERELLETNCNSILKDSYG